MYGLLRTENGASPPESVPAGTALLTLLGFAGLYVLLAFLFVLFMVRIVSRGPDDRTLTTAGSHEWKTMWFSFLAFMITMYVVLDGFDLGIGVLHLFLARTEAERDEATGAIGPIWNGNEVWLIAAGGALFMIFPKVYAAAFSGLYFGLTLALWLLVGRAQPRAAPPTRQPALAAGLRRRVHAGIAGLAFVFGVALGNVVRGVPLNRDGYFHLPLFDILNWYAVLIGVFGMTVLAMHGAGFLAFRTTGALADRARRWARALWWPSAALFVGQVAPTYEVRAGMFTKLLDHPWRLVFPLIAVTALAAAFTFQRRGAWACTFTSTSIFIVGLLAATAAGLYPHVLPAYERRPYSLTIDSGIAGETVLKTGLIWWPPALLLACTYMVFAYRMLFRAR